LFNGRYWCVLICQPVSAELNIKRVFTAHANAVEGRRTPTTVSSTTPSRSSVLNLIQSEVTQLLQQHVDNGTVLDVALSTYASILADIFYDQQQSRSAGGTVALTDSTLAELSLFVRRQVELRTRRLSQ